VEDAGASGDGAKDGGSVEEVGREDGDAGGGGGMEGEEMRGVGAGDDGGVDGVAMVLVLQEGSNQPRTDETVGAGHAHNLIARVFVGHGNVNGFLLIELIPT